MKSYYIATLLKTVVSVHLSSHISVVQASELKITTQGYVHLVVYSGARTT